MNPMTAGAFHMPGMAPPPLLNQPPQIFGGYGHDGMTMLPHDIATQLGFDPSLFDDVNDPKRRRIARACDMCRKKKIKCDGKLPSCTHCINYKTECVFTQVEKKRTPPKGAKYIEGIENRLQRMENILRLSGLLEDEDGEVDLATLEKRLEEKHGQTHREGRPSLDSQLSSQSPSLHDSNAVTPQSALASPDHTGEQDDSRRDSVQVAKKDDDEHVEALSEMMCSLVTNNQGETRYIGSSSGFSIFSPKGIQWVNERTGDCSFQEMISEVSIDDHRWTNWKPDVFGDLFRRPIYRPLPPKAEAMSLLTDFFENFNCIFPLFHQPTFMHLVERQYSSEPYQGSGWWASLNCALAIAHRLRVMSNLVPKEEDDKAWAYLKNAMGVFSELTMRNGDLLSVQALLGMALFMQGTPNPQPSFVLIAAAIRLSHSIGLHKKGSGFNLNPIETEQRKRVFWIAYMLDKDLCLRSGRPPAQDDDDTNVDLPDADPADNIGNIPLADGKGKMNIFRTMCEMTVIESKIYRRLYSAKANKLSEGEMLQTISELDKELEDWKDSIPIDFRPEHEIKASHTPLMLHVVMLHLSYYNALTTIHRMTVHRGYFTSRLSEYALKGMNSRPLSPRVFASAALCASAARASISLLKYIPQADCQVVWLVLYFPVTALVTLFGNVLQNPLDPRARSDTKLMNVVVTFLATLGQEAETGGVHRMLAVCSEFERIAKVVMEKAEREQAAKKKRKNHNHAQLELPTGAAQPPVVKHTPKPSPEGVSPRNNHNSANSHNNNREEFRSSLSPRFNGKANAELNRGSPTASASTAMSQNPSQQQSPGQWIEPFNESDMPDFSSFSDLTGFGQPMPAAPMSNPLANGGFQPMIPQDIWQVPSMSLDWDWAEKFGGAYPGFENGSTMQQ